jgi:hypothetical protein
MASGATANAGGCMLEDEGSVFVGMALQAGRLTDRSGPQLARLEAAVRLVAIGALDGPLFKPVMVRFGEIGASLDMATEA